MTPQNLSEPPSNASFELSPQAAQLQQALSEQIKRVIQQNAGVIPFSQFMQMALYQPALGYYQNGRVKIGSDGDFITAPEMGHYFARCIANSIAPMFNEPSSEPVKKILELGAGSGILAVNLLQALNEQKALPDAYFILEPSATLQQRQKQKILTACANLPVKISWLQQLPNDFEGLILANEVADAIPCERLVLRKKGWCRQGVGLADNTFIALDMAVLTDDALPPSLCCSDASNSDANNSDANNSESTQQDYQEGYQTEHRPLMKAWIKSLTKTLKKGAILLFDYGYAATDLYHPQRVSGSLQCFIHHHKHGDPLQYIGLQDITAHVDFSQIASLARDHQCEVAGFTTQAGFLLENGITEMAQIAIATASAQQRYQQSQQMQQLLMPGQMGEVVKAIMLTKGADFVVKGFSLQDHRFRL